MATNVFEISREDKENFIEALYTILKLDTIYSKEEKDFIKSLKSLIGISDFNPYELNDEERDLVKIIEKIKNKDLICYLFLIAKEAEDKQTDKSSYNKKLKDILERLSPEIKSYVNSSGKSNFETISVDEIANKAQEVGEEILHKGQEILSKINIFGKKGDKK